MKLREVQGVEVPTFFYGTAWKEDATEALVRMALEAGFGAIDTANQRRHYHEAAVGKAIAQVAPKPFLQTKYTFRAGQDHRLPYDLDASVADQVAQSCASSLSHLGVDRVDSFLLHGPSSAFGIGPADVEAWRAIEALHQEGKTRLVGVSNVSLPQLDRIWSLATIKPAFVQNRCFARDGWDREVRAFCDRHGIVYQGFSLLTANGRELASAKMRAIAARVGRTIPQVVFRFALQIGMIPLTGTTSAEHMAEDLAVYDFALSEDDVAAIEAG